MKSIILVLAELMANRRELPVTANDTTSFKMIPVVTATMNKEGGL